MGDASPDAVAPTRRIEITQFKLEKTDPNSLKTCHWPDSGQRGKDLHESIDKEVELLGAAATAWPERPATERTIASGKRSI